MTADPTRPLSSIDVLDAGEHARLDEWGNRAVLTQPADHAGVDSGSCSPRRRSAHPDAVAVSFGELFDDLPGAR